MRIGIYNHQHLRGGCPICTQTYVQGMIADGMKCMNRAKGIYGEDNEFVNYTDLGDYPSENLERPGFRRLMKDIEDLDMIQHKHSLIMIKKNINQKKTQFRYCCNHTRQNHNRYRSSHGNIPDNPQT